MIVRKTVVVRRPVDVAFRLFTEGMTSWWPLHEGYSFGGDRAKEIVLEGREGGRLYERFTDGEEHLIGVVTAYEPPARVAFTWGHRDPEGHTEVEVRFVPQGEGTRVELEHRGFDRLGERAGEVFRGYHRGWDVVLERFVRA
jgi:uncharacterized protein YndB with AHSA1/START domain